MLSCSLYDWYSLMFMLKTSLWIRHTHFPLTSAVFSKCQKPYDLNTACFSHICGGGCRLMTIQSLNEMLKISAVRCIKPTPKCSASCGFEKLLKPRLTRSTSLMVNKATLNYRTFGWSFACQPFHRGESSCRQTIYRLSVPKPECNIC